MFSCAEVKAERWTVFALLSVWNDCYATDVFLRLPQGLCCAKYVHCAANGTNDGNTIRIGRSHTGNVIRIDAADSHAWQGFCRGYRGETIQADSRVGISL